MDKSQDFTKAKELGKKELAELPKIIKLSLDKQNRRLVFDLTNSVTLIVPADLLQGLQNASENDLTAVEFWDEGLMVYWKNLDVAFQTSSLLLGIFGTKRWLSEINSRNGKQTPRKNGKLIKSVA
ncbi:MAG: DUF2442 domain-containing protein [Acidobacteria bacterium]|nr:DUF2442 domain-containing protein [Acidobacteriota bacterium]MDQ3749580.1 DUF2442 domain-containing protein [Acidobacteriota bacterium]